ncbi:MAG TPA: PII uridylyl-transferase [Pseudomonadales bacterium]|nr:PII uridylyl-transferase [Pseudomonadales bacterium]
MLWNSWRASLMRQLYTETRRALRRGLENMVDKQERITETQSEALQLLQQAEVSLSAAQEIWRNLGEDYFLRESAADIAWHTAAIHAHATLDRPLVLIKETPSRQFDEATQLFIYTRNQANLFAAIAAAMEQLSLSIQDARIITSDNDMALNTYYVLDEEGRPLINDRRLLQQITQRLTQDLADPTLYPHVVRRHVRRQLKQFPIPTEVLLYTDAIKNHTVLEVITADRPGLLARIGQIFMEFDIYLLKAKIATLGERIDDVFFITDKNRQPIADPVICQRLKQTLCAQLDAQSQG